MCELPGYTPADSPLSPAPAATPFLTEHVTVLPAAGYRIKSTWPSSTGISCSHKRWCRSQRVLNMCRAKNNNNNWQQNSLSAATTVSCGSSSSRWRVRGIIIWFMRLANGKCCCCRRISATHTHNKETHTQTQ